MMDRNRERMMKNKQPESRGVDGNYGAGGANTPQKKVRNLQYSKQKGMRKTNGGW